MNKWVDLLGSNYEILVDKEKSLIVTHKSCGRTSTITKYAVNKRASLGECYCVLCLSGQEIATRLANQKRAYHWQTKLGEDYRVLDYSNKSLIIFHSECETLFTTSVSSINSRINSESCQCHNCLPTNELISKRSSNKPSTLEKSEAKVLARYSAMAGIGYEVIYKSDDMVMVLHHECNMKTVLHYQTFLNRVRRGVELCTTCSNRNLTAIRNWTNKVGNKYRVNTLNTNKLNITHLKCNSTFDINPTTCHDRIKVDNVVCTSCNPLTQPAISHKESQLFDLVDSLCTSEIIRGDRKLLSGQEIDIYIPDLNLAFEFNGTYWHSSKLKDKNYHLNKSINCAEQGVRLIHVWEHEWESGGIRDFIIRLLSPIEKIYARSCKIVELDAKSARQFIDSFHLQGFVGATKYYGLKFNDELVQVMTFKYTSKASNAWEIGRLVSSGNNVIVGGASRLLKHFERCNDPSSLITYSHGDYFTGAVYESIGMTRMKRTGPGYCYVYDDFTSRSRQSMQTANLIKNGEIGSGDTLSESQRAEKFKLNKIYNSGNHRFIKRY